MPTQLPKASDFPKDLHLDVISPPISSHHLANVLILLHGLGDSNASFSNLARQLRLPETICISLRAPTPLPFELGGFHWGDDIVFDQTSGKMEFDTGFAKSVKILQKEIIENVLQKNCGYRPKEIMLFGFGQGAMAAIATAQTIPEDLGGIISIGGPLPASITLRRSSTPLLVLGGSSDTLITRSVLANLRSAFEFVDYQKWTRSGDEMPQTRDEMLPIMRFFALRLRSYKWIPEGSVELK